MSDNPYRVLLFLKDGDSLCRLGRFLELFGFQVVTTTQHSAALSAVAAQEVDFLVGDWKLLSANKGSSLRDIRKSAPANFFAIAALDFSTPIDLENAVEAGFDDFVSAPIIPGELLSRLRAGARSLEFDRRMELLQSVSAPQDILAEDVLRGEIYRRLQSPGAPNSQEPLGWIILVEADHFAQVQRWQGKRQATQIQNSLLQIAREQVKVEDRLAKLSNSRLAILLPAQSLADARRWCEGLQKSFVSRSSDQGRDSRHHDSFTASIGLAPVTPTTDVADIWELAERTLELAQRRGGACFTTSEDAKQEHTQWQKLADSGELLASATAGDVMLPCPATVYAGDSLEQAQVLLRSTRLPVLPVVDADGALLGLIRAEDVVSNLGPANGTSARGSSVRLVRKLLHSQVVRCEDSAPLAHLMELFTGQEESVAVIQRAGRSVGLVFCQQLAALTQPLSREQLSLGPNGFEPDGELLVVGEPSLLEEVEVAE